MLDSLETFLAVAQEQTMVRAATRLRVTQSAVSKRIAALEAELGTALFRRVGRNFQLTDRGEHIARFAAPLLAELRGVLHATVAAGKRRISLSVSSGLITSWGPQILRRVEQRMGDIEFQINTYSSTVSVDRVRSGDHLLALCHGTGATAADLAAVELGRDEMVIVAAGGGPFRFPVGGTFEVVGPEEHSESWYAIRHQVARAARRWSFSLEVARSLVSFAGTVQMARAGFGHGLVPRSVATALGVPDPEIHSFPDPGIYLPVNLVGRKRGMEDRSTKEMIKALRMEMKAAKVFPGGRNST